MKQPGSSKSQLWACLVLTVVAAASYAASLSGAIAGPDSSATNTPSLTKTDAPVEKKKAKKLTGAELYTINCNRCHAERYPTEFNPAHWKTLMTHMRVRANLPAAQAREILKYLQEEGGN